MTRDQARRDLLIEINDCLERAFAQRGKGSGRIVELIGAFEEVVRVSALPNTEKELHKVRAEVDHSQMRIAAMKQGPVFTRADMRRALSAAIDAMTPAQSETALERDLVARLQMKMSLNADEALAEQLRLQARIVELEAALPVPEDDRHICSCGTTLICPDIGCDQHSLVPGDDPPAVRDPFQEANKFNRDIAAAAEILRALEFGRMPGGWSQEQVIKAWMERPDPSSHADEGPR